MPNLLYRKAIVGDAHFADYHSRRLDDYRATCLRKVAQVQDLCTTLGITDIFQLGDWFHIKAPSKTSHRIIQDLIQLLRKWKGLRGNHDMKDGNIDLDGQPLMSLVRAGVVELLDGLGELGFAGIGYREEYEKDPALLVERVRSIVGAKVVAMHQSIFPPKTAWFPAIDLELFDQLPIDGILNGHIHDGMGLWAKFDTGWKQLVFEKDVAINLPKGVRFFLNVGSLLRGSIDEVAINRKVGFVEMCSYDDGSYSFKFHEIQVAPAADILKIREHLQAKSKAQEFEAFKAAVHTVGANKSLDLRTALSKYCETARIPREVEDESWRYLSEAAD